MTIRRQLTAVLWLAVTPALAQEPAWFGVPPGPWPVGFRVARLADAERPFFAAESDSSIARPIQVYLWYPASAEAEDREDRPLTLHDIVAWLGVEGSGAELDDARVAAGRREFIDHFVAVGADAAAAERVLEIQVLSRADAAAAPGPFPVILLAGGYDGSPILHAGQAEHLASHGYVVLGAPGLGAERRAMAFTASDVEAQVRDLVVVREYARGLPFADAARPEVVGFSVVSRAARTSALPDPKPWRGDPGIRSSHRTAARGTKAPRSTFRSSISTPARTAESTCPCCARLGGLRSSR